MKNIRLHIIPLFLALSVVLSSCFEEKEDEYKVVGAVATIPVFTLSKINPIAGEQITVNIRYYSEHVQVNELRLTETVGTGTAAVVQTKSITGFDIKSSYTDSFVYTVPAVAVGTKIVLRAEVQTVNELVNSQFGTITIN